MEAKEGRRVKVNIFCLVTLSFYFISDFSYAGKVLILSLNFLPHYENFIDEIEPNNRVLMLPSKKIEEEEFERRKPNYYEIVRIANYLESAEVEQKALELHLLVGIDRIIAIDEFDILRAARLRTLLGIKGQSYESALAFRDKVRMKRLLRKAEIEIPNFIKAKSGVDLVEFSQTNGFPFIVKPRRGAGSLGAMIIRSQEDLQNLLLKKGVFNDYHESTLEAESYIEGDMYHINGFVFQGKVVSCWPSMYLRDSEKPMEGGCQYNASSYILSDSNPKVAALNTYTKSILRALPTPENTAFHLEVFITPQNKIIFCEIASRVGGGGTKSYWNRSFGVDLIRDFVRVQAGLDPSNDALKFPYKTECITGDILFPKRLGKVIKIPLSCPFKWASEYKVFSKVGDVLSEPKELADRIAEINLIEASSEEEFRERMELARRWFYDNTLIE